MAGRTWGGGWSLGDRAPRRHDGSFSQTEQLPRLHRQAGTVQYIEGQTGWRVGGVQVL